MDGLEINQSHARQSSLLPIENHQVRVPGLLPHSGVVTCAQVGGLFSEGIERVTAESRAAD